MPTDAAEEKRRVSRREAMAIGGSVVGALGVSTVAWKTGFATDFSEGLQDWTTPDIVTATPSNPDSEYVADLSFQKATSLTDPDLIVELDPERTDEVGYLALLDAGEHFSTTQIGTSATTVEVAINTTGGGKYSLAIIEGAEYNGEFVPVEGGEVLERISFEVSRRDAE